MIKFSICDDQELFRRGIRNVLCENGFEFVGEAGNGVDAWSMLDGVYPDVLICDINMPKMNGLELLSKINQLRIPVKVLMLSGYDNDDYLMQSYQAGASGYLLKEAEPAELVMAIKKIYQGGIYFGQHAAIALFKQVKELKEKGVHAAFAKLKQKLSAREMEVIEHIVSGLTNKEIADKMFLSVRTIDSHRANIQEKLNAKNTADLVRIYYKGE